MFFGTLITLNLQTSFPTPPMAMSAYYLKGTAPKDVQRVTVFKGYMPFPSAAFVAVAAVHIFPQRVCWLPEVP